MSRRFTRGGRVDNRDRGPFVSAEWARALDPTGLYLGDNGRCFCGSMRCAGMTAYTSGRDLSGQRVYRLRVEDEAEGRRMSAEFPGFRCETCGARLGEAARARQ